MIARGFKPVGWVAAVGAAALGCYMISLNVASERAELLAIEREISTAKREIRALETELGTRGRFAQLEHWNSEVLALSAPASHQILSNAFKLASFNVPPPSAADKAENIRLASAEAPPPQAMPEPVLASAVQSPEPQAVPMLRRASLVSTGKPAAPIKVAAPVPVPAKAEPRKLAAAPKPEPKKVPAPVTAPKKASLFDGGLAKEIGEAAKAEANQSIKNKATKNKGGAAAR